jgi:hypothetical protein
VATRKSTDQPEPLPNPDDVLRVMLNTPPQPHVARKPKKPPKKKVT